MNDPETLNKYLDWLDELEKTNPEKYKQLMSEMQNELLEKNAGVSPDIDQFAAALHGINENETDFKPKFPGNQVMGPNGLGKQQEGTMIDVTPSFVMKTSDGNSKVFINFCYSDHIQEFSQQTKLDDEGKEIEGIHVPLSLGPPRAIQDKAGKNCVAFDVAVNTKVIENCKEDKNGTFRNFLCELAIEYVHQKYKKKLDLRYKLPRSTYQGQRPPPQHHIRKSQTPVIQDITNEVVAKTSNNNNLLNPNNNNPNNNNVAPLEMIKTTKTKKPVVLERMTYSYFCQETWNGENKSECNRTPAVEGGVALSDTELATASKFLVLEVLFSKEEPQDIQVELACEYLVVKSMGYHTLELFLPYPVNEDKSSCEISTTQQKLIVTMPILQKLQWTDPDPGSTPWMLSQALDLHDETRTTKEEEIPVDQRFHLQSNDNKIKVKYDTVKEEDVLPEDRFHANDIMSQHLLQQRKNDREEKQIRSEKERKERKEQAEKKRLEAQKAGKTWEEMYPNEMEPSFIDLDEIQSTKKPPLKEEQYIPTEKAVLAAASWLERQKNMGMKHANSLAFELL